MKKMTISDLKISSFITNDLRPKMVKGGITGLRCEGPTTPHVCPTQDLCLPTAGCTNYPCFDTGTNPGHTQLCITEANCTD